MRQKIIGTGIGVTLVMLAAVGAFASQDAVNLLADPTATPTSADATSTTTPNPTATGTAAATQTPDGTATSTPAATETAAPTGTPGATNTPEATATAGASATPDATGTPSGGDDDEEVDDDVHGIPDSNPSHKDDDGDGECEKGETTVKTTPSGTDVTVPCQADKHGSNKDNGNRDDGRDHGKSGDNGE